MQSLDGIRKLVFRSKSLQKCLVMVRCNYSLNPEWRCKGDLRVGKEICLGITKWSMDEDVIEVKFSGCQYG